MISMRFIFRSLFRIFSSNLLLDSLCLSPPVYLWDLCHHSLPSMLLFTLEFASWIESHFFPTGSLDTAISSYSTKFLVSSALLPYSSNPSLMSRADRTFSTKLSQAPPSPRHQIISLYTIPSHLHNFPLSSLRNGTFDIPIKVTSTHQWSSDQIPNPCNTQQLDRKA